jgi:hypothetical protein
VKRTIPITFLLVAWQPLLVGSGILTKRTIECAGGAYASTVPLRSAMGHAADCAAVGLTWFAVARPWVGVIPDRS